MRSLLLLALIASPATAQDKPVLTVLTYDSFASEWGPGPAVTPKFEAICGCTLKFETAGDGAALLSRVRLEGASSKADVVLGLDTSLTAQAQATGLFAPHTVTAKLDLPIDWTDDTFVPFDWGWFAFVYDKTRVKDVPTSFEALAASDLRVVIEDPRSSTPGLGGLLWVKQAYGDKAAGVWEGLKDNIVTVTPGWTEAYNMFLEGEADMVLSYTTSPAYHLLAEKDDTKAAAVFTEGNYLQVEVAGKLAGTTQPELADKFLDFVLSDDFQSEIAQTNWMYPAVTPKAGLPEGFDQYRPSKTLLMSPDEAQSARGPALEEWRTALSK